MRNITKVVLKRNSDVDIYVFFEKGMRGGVSYIFKRYSKARNKYLKYYDPKKEWKHIICLDASNLYGYTMSAFLPTDLNQSQWLKPYIEFNNNKKNGSTINGEKNGKALHKWKTMKSNEKLEMKNWCKTREQKKTKNKERAIYQKNI